MSQITYELLDKTTGAHKAWLSEDGTLGGPPMFCGPEPVFAGQLNVGAGQLVLQVDRYPGPGLAYPIPFPNSCGFDYCDLVKIFLPDGTEMGTWKYEGYTADLAANNVWQVNLMPLATELHEVDYAANYSAADLPYQPHLGTTLFDVPVLAAVPRTKHCSVVAHANDGVHYSVVYSDQNGRVADTLRQAVTLGGADWWWFCNGHGQVELRHGARRTVDIPVEKIAWEKHDFNINPAINVLALQGGYDPGGLPYRTTRTVAGGPFGTATVGRRVGQPLIDPTLLDLATLNKIGDQILARAQVPIDRRTLRLVGVEILTPGDAVHIIDAGVVNGPWYVTDSRLFGSLGVQEVTIATQ